MKHKHKWISYCDDTIIKCSCGRKSFPNKKKKDKHQPTGFGKCHANLSYDTKEHNKKYHNKHKEVL